MSVDLRSLSPAELRKLLERPDIGAVLRKRIESVLQETTAKLAPAGRPSERRMNKTEARWWATMIEPRLRAGEILWCEHEALKLRLGEERTFYSPDFAAVLPDGSIEITEVKGGFVREDSRVKFQAAARLYPFWRWRMVQWRGGRWRTLYDYPAARRPTTGSSYVNA